MLAIINKNYVLMIIILRYYFELNIHVYVYFL